MIAGAVSTKELAAWRIFAATIRMFRRNFGSAIVVLGVLSVLSNAPMTIGQKLFPALAESLGKVVWALLWTPWTTFFYSGQVFYSLDVARTGRSEISRWWDGRAYWAPVLGINIAMALPSSILGIDVADISRSPIAATLFLLIVMLMVALLPRVAFAFHVAVNENLGTVRAFRRSWEISRGHWWRLVRFFVVMMVLYLPLFMLAHKQPAAVAILFDVFAVPILHLASSALYLRVLDTHVAAPLAEAMTEQAHP